MPLFGKWKAAGEMSGTHRYENRFVGFGRRTGFFCVLLPFLAGGVTPDALAQESREEDVMLSPVVVTASRGERLEEHAIASTTVITAEAIQNRRLADLPSILRSEAGVEFDRMGGPGMVTSVYMRGSNANRVLVQIDGVPVNDGSVMGSAALLSHLQPDQIERIEVVRGDVTAIYGGGASGGVIRIFTKQGEGKPSVRLFGEYGSRDTSRMGAGVSGRVNDTRFSLSAVHSETDGFSTMSSSKNPLVNDDRDGDRLDTISGSLSHRFGTDGEIGARWYFSDARYDYDVGSGPDEINTGENRQWVGALYGKKRMTADWLSSVTLSRMEIDRHYETKNGLVRPPVQWGGTMCLPIGFRRGRCCRRMTRTGLRIPGRNIRCCSGKTMWPCPVTGARQLAPMWHMSVPSPARTGWTVCRAATGTVCTAVYRARQGCTTGRRMSVTIRSTMPVRNGRGIWGMHGGWRRIGN